MAEKSENLRKSETLQLRVVPAVKEALKYGTGSVAPFVVTGETITDFMIEAALEKLASDRGIEVTVDEIKKDGKPVIRIVDGEARYIEPEESS